ncbi:hypothetical protein RvY_19351 [Ramazzottius varieornatus]|uniref:Chitin-binding type-2 domain-containing protein n=1 Tax=Ramazzottius varieornatus TaxID=947166 RepID=A0A1D1W941_RAMVA|nr:hypothetical protein RvY_19351 [Ramazzottius varieornatus]
MDASVFRYLVLSMAGSLMVALSVHGQTTSAQDAMCANYCLSPNNPSNPGGAAPNDTASLYVAYTNTCSSLFCCCDAATLNCSYNYQLVTCFPGFFFDPNPNPPGYTCRPNIEMNQAPVCCDPTTNNGSIAPGCPTTTPSNPCIGPSSTVQTTTALSASTTALPPAKHKCYDRCDATYCGTKQNGFYEVSPCSRNYCKCTNGTGAYFSCASGKYFDGSVPPGPTSCRFGNATWCPPNGGLSGPPPPNITELAPLCNATNCVARNNSNMYYALDCCSPNWCYCYSNTNATVQTCPPGQYFDSRSEWVKCRPSNLLEFCPTTFVTTTAAPATSASTGCPTGAPTTTVAPTTTTAAPTTTTAPPTTTTALVSTTTAAVQQPNCYSRCDVTFCNGKAPNYYASHPCSRNLCGCNTTTSGNTTAQYYGCAAGRYFDQSSQTCKLLGDNTCPTSGTPKSTQPKTSVEQLCNAQNCNDRRNQATYYPLDCCSPFWCYCFSNGTRAVQTCPTGQIYDHRPEWVQCRDNSLVEYCLQ